MRILFAFYFGVELTERFSTHWVNYEMTGVKGMCSVAALKCMTGPHFHIFESTGGPGGHGRGCGQPDPAGPVKRSV